MSVERRRRPVRTAAATSIAIVVALITVALVRAGAAAPAAADTASPLAGPSGASPPAIQLYTAHGDASLVPALEGERPLYILSLGSDARPGQAITGQRSDSIHIIGINLSTHRASILGFPRDSWVNIPGHGMNKINAAMTYGGPALTIATLEGITGIHIDFWMLTSFPGLVNLVNGIGGLTVDVPFHMNDAFSGAHFTPGVHHMNGKQALSFARDRHDLPRGDLDRSHDQGILLLSALAKLHEVFAADPGTMFDWIAVGWRQVHTNLSVATLLQLGLTASQISVANVNNAVVPATGGTVGSSSVVFISPSASKIFADMRADGVIGNP